MVYFLIIISILQFLNLWNNSENDKLSHKSRNVHYYKVTSDENLLLPGHLYNKSSGTSVEINQEILGVGNIIAPPFFCYPFKCILSLFDSPVKVSDFEWHPSGTHLNGKEANGIRSEMKITPLWESRGVLATAILQNQTNKDIEVNAKWKIEGLIGSTDHFDWYPPFAMKSSIKEIGIIKKQSKIIFHNDTTYVLIAGSDIIVDQLSSNENILEKNFIFSPKETKAIKLVILIGNNLEDLLQQAEKVLMNHEKIWTDGIKRHEKLLNDIHSSVPVLEGASSELSSFYTKGLLTFTTCKWEVPEFIYPTWYAESGLDGGALNNYLWGIAYIGKLMTIIDPQGVRRLLIAYTKADLKNTYALNPSTGEGMGVLYSYNYYSIAKITYDYITITGDVSILNEKIGNKNYLEIIYDFCLSKEDLKRKPRLIDYGSNENLLELRKTNNYSHFTPSPNAERYLIYKYLIDFHSWSGKNIPDDLRKRGEQLKKVFQTKLWDDENNWLYSLNTDSHPITSYSIQIFDVLRTKILTKNQQQKLVSHLNKNEFLTQWGVYSLAVGDEGYDHSDVDWGGPGVYAGDAPELIEDLIHAGFINEGIDLLERILWWGRFPYLPQAIRADKMGYREDGRPNVIAGLATTQSIIFGLFGITVGKDDITIKPVNHPVIKGLSLKGLSIRQQNFDISIDATKNEFQVKSNGRNYLSEIGNEVTVRFQ